MAQTNNKVIYPGRDLEAMSFAVNYHRWILDEFRPFLGRRVVEVGAGTGSFSRLLLNEELDKLVLIEPSEMFEQLKTGLDEVNGLTVEFHQTIFAEVSETIARTVQPDSILYVNVLEHIEDDRRELEIAYDTLEAGGCCFIFLPALRGLFGRFDRKIGHFRRYSKYELDEKSRAVGFKILVSKYFDLAGIVPWCIKYRLFRSESLDERSVQAYDKLVVPLLRRFERVVKPPIGKNILLVASK